MYILIMIAAIYTYTQNHKFLSVSSIVNIISLSAANIPIALGIAGMIVLTCTTFCWSSCRSDSMYFCITFAVYGLCNEDVPESSAVAIPVVILIVVVVGGIVGWVNGLFVAKFNLHPFSRNTGNTADCIRYSSS